MSTTPRELCTAALRLARKVASGVDATTEEANIAIAELNRMVRAWQNKNNFQWTHSRQSVTLVAAQVEYTLNPVRPFKIQNVRRKTTDGTETPMLPMMREEYDFLPRKDSEGTPTSWYYDRQASAAKFYVWPAPPTGTTDTVEITYWREISDMTLDGAIDLPYEWQDAAVYNLAWRMHQQFPTSGVSQQDLKMEANRLLFEALGSDTEESVFFAGGG